MTTEQIRYEFEVITGDAVKELDAFSSAFNAVGKGFKQAGSLSKSISKTFGGVTNSVKGLTKAFSALTGVALGKALSDGAKEAIDLYESINLLKVTFGDASDEAQEFVEKVTDMYGFDTRTIVDMMGSFKAMGNAVGMTSDVSSDLSKSLTAMTVDLSSLLNMELDTTFNRVQSAMRGMSRAALGLNMDIRATTVEAYANSKGIEKQFETMTEAERELLRYMLMVQQSQDAMGDFAATADFNANRLRVLNQQFTEVGRVIGQFFKPALDAVLPVLIGVTMVVKELLLMLASLMGVSINWDDIAGGSGGQNFYDAQEGIEGIGEAADGTKKKIDKLLAPFDELNVLSENTGSGSAGGIGGSWTDIDPAILALFKEMQYELANADTKANQIKESILAFMGITPKGDSWVYAPDVFEKNLKEKLPNWTQTIEALFDLDYKRLLGNVANIFSDLGNIFKRSAQIVLEDFERITGFDFGDASLAKWLRNLNTNLEDLHTWLQDNQEEVANFIAKFAEFATIAAVVSAVLGPIGSALVTIGIASMGISGAFSAISTLLGVISPAFSGLLTVFTSLSVASTTLKTYLLGFKNALGATTKSLALAGTSGSSFVGILQSLLTSLASISSYIVAVGASMTAIFVGGFIKWAATSDEFRAHLSRWGEALGTIFGGIGDIFTTLWTSFMYAIDVASIRLSGFFDGVVGTVSSLLEIFAGLIEFITGVFTGDWERAWRGVSDIFWGFANLLNSIMVAMANLIITGINLMIEKIVNGVISAVNNILEGISELLAFVGITISWSIPEVPTIPPIPATPLPRFGNGGVVTGPTRALIGEAGRDEMVMPLDNSPQMLDFIDKIADRVSGGGETVVKVYIGDREWDAFTYESAQRGQKLVGAQPIKEGRA